jgi:menaquinone-dependent protoporphyrinogen oxidase
MSRILVAYASKHNATAEIAERIGEILRRTGGRTVDVLPADDVSDIAPYDAVILGSAVYMGQWQPDATDFLKTFEVELAKRPTWLFSCGPTAEGDPVEALKGWRLPEALQPIADRVRPRDIKVFGGRLFASQLSLYERFIARMVHLAQGDYRDWNAIRGWASSISQAI